MDTLGTSFEWLQRFYDATTRLLSEAPTGRVDLGADQRWHDALQALTALRAQLRDNDMVTHDESWWHYDRKQSVAPVERP